MLQRILLSMILFSSFQMQANPLAPAIIGCLLSHGDCLTDTGIPFVDQFFGAGVKTQFYSAKDQCDLYKESWCSSWPGYSNSGYKHCKEAKIAYYKKKNPNADIEWAERAHGRDYFVCNANQREVFIKAKCGLNDFEKKYIYVKNLDCSKND